MAELSHGGLRKLIADFGGCDYFYTEMISTNALLHKGPYESCYLDTTPGAEKVVFQLVGHSISAFTSAAKRLAQIGPAGININMGCSAPALTQKGWGVSWMARPKEAFRLVEQVADATAKQSNVPVSVKVRAGYKYDIKALTAFLLGIEAAGASAIILHPKLAGEKHDRPANWHLFKKHFADMTELLSIPLHANGNLDSVEMIHSIQETCSPAGIMIGRKAVTAPWFFALYKGKFQDPAFSMQINIQETALRFLEYLRQHQHQDFHLPRTKRFFLYYCRNLFHSHEVFREINNSHSTGQIESIITAYFDRNPEERLRLIK